MTKIIIAFALAIPIMQSIQVCACMHACLLSLGITLVMVYISACACMARISYNTWTLGCINVFQLFEVTQGSDQCFLSGFQK